MRVVLLNGGLANQVFQYIFMRFGQLMCPQETWILDDTAFYMAKEHNGYELNTVFGLKPHLLSEQFDADTWEDIIRLRKKGYGIPQIFSESGTKIDLLLAECQVLGKHAFEGLTVQLSCNQYNPLITKIKGFNVYYYGYWVNKSWFDGFREQFLTELTFPPLEGEANLRYYQTITSCESVAIHVRRGDYVECQWDLNASYYLNSTQKILKLVPDAHFFIFSDDIPWCRENSKECGFDRAKQVTFVEGNVSPRNYIDMQLMTECKHIILSNSAFCYLAVLLKQGDGYVINPTDREI